jgi:hypothetical protein
MLPRFISSFWAQVICLASQVARTTGMYHHAQLQIIFYIWIFATSLKHYIPYTLTAVLLGIFF